MAALDTARVRTAALTALGVTAYYAVPDVVARRGARAAVKAAVAVGLTGLSTVDYLTTSTPPEREGLEELQSLWKSRDAGEKAALVALAAAGFVGAVALTVATERGIYRAGERRAAAGKRGAHLRGALVLGALSGAAALLPPGAPSH